MPKINAAALGTFIAAKTEIDATLVWLDAHSEYRRSGSMSIGTGSQAECLAWQHSRTC